MRDKTKTSGLHPVMNRKSPNPKNVIQVLFEENYADNIGRVKAI